MLRVDTMNVTDKGTDPPDDGDGAIEVDARREARTIVTDYLKAAGLHRAGSPLKGPARTLVTRIAAAIVTARKAGR